MTTPQTPASPSHPSETSPNLDETLTAPVPGFRPLPPARQDDPNLISPSSTTTEQTPNPSSATSTRRPDTRDDAASSEHADPSSTTPETGARPASTADLEQLGGNVFVPLIAIGFQLVGMGLNRKLAPGTSAWMPTEQEIGGVAFPLANIAGRRAPALPGKAAADVTDGAELLAATVSYASRSLDEMRSAVAPDQSVEGGPVAAQ